jgi:hypothetical protein
MRKLAVTGSIMALVSIGASMPARFLLVPIDATVSAVLTG